LKKSEARSRSARHKREARVSVGTAASGYFEKERSAFPFRPKKAQRVSVGMAKKKRSLDSKKLVRIWNFGFGILEKYGSNRQRDYSKR
jgi:hypothetical protein